MNQKNAKNLLDYVKADTPKYGPNPVNNAYGSGPGGAAANAKKVIRDIGNAKSLGEKDNVGYNSLQDKYKRTITQMNQVRDIYNNAASTLKRNKQPSRDI